MFNMFDEGNALPEIEFPAVVCVGTASIEDSHEPEDDRSGRISVAFEPSEEHSTPLASGGSLTLWIEPEWLEKGFNPGVKYKPVFDKGEQVVLKMRKLREKKKLSADDDALCDLWRRMDGFRRTFFNPKGSDAISKLCGDNRGDFNVALVAMLDASEDGITVADLAGLLQRSLPADLGYFYWLRQMEINGEAVEAYRCTAFEPLTEDSIAQVTKRMSRSKYEAAFDLSEE